jgi:hypothetical protein
MPACRLVIVAFPQPAEPATAIDFWREYGRSRRMRSGVESLQLRTPVTGDRAWHQQVASQRCLLGRRFS